MALVASAQTQSSGQNPGTNAPVAIPPDALAQPQPGIQPQPAGDRWADAFRIQKVSEDDDWTRHFRLGAVAGLNISANFSMKGPSKIPGNNAAKGIYDDGYVRTDDTGNAGGWTSYWGYNNASQLSGSTLTMHSTTSYSASGSSEASGVFPGFDMAYGGNLFYLGRARIGWDLGFGLLPISITDKSSMPASVNQSIYTFKTGTIIVPGAPYQGGPSGIGATIKTNVDISSGTNNAGTLNGSQTLEVMFYTVRLGPAVYWDLNEHFGLSASAGPAIGIVSGDYKYDEIVSASGVSARNHGQIGATDLVYGGYVNTTLMYHVPKENADIYIGAQFMSLGNASFSGGGREASLKLGGQVYISAGINWAF
jgi:hypothetical protein